MQQVLLLARLVSFSIQALVQSLTIASQRKTETSILSRSSVCRTLASKFWYTLYWMSSGGRGRRVTKSWDHYWVATQCGGPGVWPPKFYLKNMNVTSRILAVSNDCKTILKSTFFMSNVNFFSSKSWLNLWCVFNQCKNSGSKMFSQFCS